MNVLIYTVIINNYDTLSDVTGFQRENVTFKCYSNTHSKTECEAKGWKSVVIEKPAFGYKNACLENRILKFFEFTPGQYDIVVYLDGNKHITNIDKLLEWCKELYDSDKQMILSKHWGRNTVKEELSEVVMLGKCETHITNLEYNCFLKDGFKDDVGLYCASVQIRKTTNAVNEFLKRWLDEYKKFQTRDQLSLPYVIWKSNMLDKIKVIETSELLSFVKHMRHLL
jgi:hypothetical protein